MVAELLRASSVHAYYGESHVLHGVDCHVSRGEVVTLLAAMGRRTTTLKTLLGLIASRSGSVVINGRETISLAPHQIAHLGVGYCPEERGIYASLTTEENLLLPRRSRRGNVDRRDLRHVSQPAGAARKPRHASLRR